MLSRGNRRLNSWRFSTWNLTIARHKNRSIWCCTLKITYIIYIYMSVPICIVETVKKWWCVVWPSQYMWRNKLHCEHYDLCSIRSLYFRHNFLGLHIQDTENLCETYSGMQALFISLRQYFYYPVVTELFIHYKNILPMNMSVLYRREH